MRHWPDDLDAVLLYPAPVALCPDDILSALNRRLGDYVAPFALAAGPATADRAVLTNGSLRLSLRASSAPVAGARLAAALGSAFARVRAADYAGAVARHRAALFVSLSPEPGATVAPETRVTVAHSALRVLIGRARPEVVHWSQSDNLFTPDEIIAADGFGFPVTLVTHPEIFRTGGDGRLPVQTGFTSRNSELFFGKPVVVEPSAMPLEMALTFVDFGIMRRLHGVDIFTDGAQLALSSGVEIHVSHRVPSQRFPRGAIALTLVTLGPKSGRDLPPVAPRPRPDRPLIQVPLSA